MADMTNQHGLNKMSSRLNQTNQRRGLSCVIPSQTEMPAHFLTSFEAVQDPWPKSKLKLKGSLIVNKSTQVRVAKPKSKEAKFQSGNMLNSNNSTNNPFLFVSGRPTFSSFGTHGTFLLGSVAAAQLEQSEFLLLYHEWWPTEFPFLEMRSQDLPWYTCVSFRLC